jgi:uncharacterized SAM-binding protein YcdF (DUF218 family)
MEELSLRLLIKSLILPPTAQLLLAFIGLVLIFTARRRLGLALVAMGLVTLWTLSTPIVANELVNLRQYSDVLDLSRPAEARAIVILAGGARRSTREYGGPSPETRTLQRLAYGARVARKTQLPVLVSGGEIESASMVNMLRQDFDIHPHWIDTAATNTRDNAAHSRTILAKESIDRVILVTSALHMPRASNEFTAQGFSVVAAPVDVRVIRDHNLTGLIPGIAALRDSEYVVYEAIAGLVSAYGHRFTAAERRNLTHVRTD